MLKNALILIKKILPISYYDYLTHGYIKIFKCGRFSLGNIDLKLEKYLSYNNGFYIELGANNGFRQSNTYYLELKKNWRGILIEAAKENFLSCIKYRGKRNIIHCNACVSFKYNQKFVNMKYADLMTTSLNLQNDIHDLAGHLRTAKNHLSKRNKPYLFKAIAKTLTQILNESNAPKIIDFLSLDVEGAEIEVLKGIDFNKYIFKYMLIESRNIEHIQKYLKKNNYLLEDKLTHHDYLFKKKSI